MRKKSMSRPRPKTTSRVAGYSTSQQIRDIQREVRRLDDPVRYAVYQRPFRGVDVRFFLDVCEDAFRLSVWPHATLFKQERIARLVAKAFSVQQQRVLRVARVTIDVRGKRGGGAKR